MIIVRKIGVVNVIVNIVLMIDRKVWRNEVRDLGIMLLILLMFLEKWFMIFFWGVVLKNDMGECMMLINIFWWRYCDVICDLVVMVMEVKRMNIVCEKFSVL